MWADAVGREDTDVKEEDDEEVEDEADANDRLERPEGGRGKIFGLGVMDLGVFGCVGMGDDGCD